MTEIGSNKINNKPLYATYSKVFWIAQYMTLELLQVKDRLPLSSLFAFNQEGTVTICSYIPKKKKNVILISTMHNDDNVSGPKSKPEIIHYYNTSIVSRDTMFTEGPLLMPVTV